MKLSPTTFGRIILRTLRLSLPSSLKLRRASRVTLAFLLLLIPLTLYAQGGGSSSAGGKPIKLLEPLPGGVTEIAVTADPFGALNAYLNPMLTWIIGISAGLAVLMVIIGGLQIILSAGDQGKIGEGKTRILCAIFGLLFLVFSAAILNLLNAYFYRLVP